MYRRSSKGNPYHDELGRFTSASGKGNLKNRKRSDDVNASKPVLWSSFGERIYKAEIDKNYDGKWEKADNERTDIAVNDGRRFYHNQSIKREKYAKSLSQIEIPKGLSVAKRRLYVERRKKLFEKENEHAIERGGVVIYYRKKNSNQIAAQIVQSDRMKNDIMSNGRIKNATSVTRNTSTSMKQFSGFTVEYTKDNLVRSCPKNASEKEIVEHIGKFCDKHRDATSPVDVCVKIWTDNGGRVRYSTTVHFDDDHKSDAEKFAKSVGGIVVSHDDGTMA